MTSRGFGFLLAAEGLVGRLGQDQPWGLIQGDLED